MRDLNVNRVGDFNSPGLGFGVGPISLGVQRRLESSIFIGGETIDPQVGYIGTNTIVHGVIYISVKTVIGFGTKVFAGVSTPLIELESITGNDARGLLLVAKQPFQILVKCECQG